MSRVKPHEAATEDRDTADHDQMEPSLAKYFETEPRTRIKVDVAGKTHPGLVRQNNEDQYLVVRRHRGREILATSLPTEILDPATDHAYTFAVADGLGGQQFGEIASLLALRNGFELGGDEIKWTVRLNDHEIRELQNKAEVFCQYLDESLRAEIRDHPRLKGMATTLTLCYTTGPNLFTVHIGDSRAYLYRDGILRQLTRDHTLGQQLIDLGEAEPQSPEVRRFRHVLTNCIGGSEAKVFADFDHYELAHGDVLLLCTDGLYEMAKKAEIASILSKDQPMKDACEQMLDLALTKGGKDNVTVVAARFEFDGDR